MRNRRFAGGRIQCRNFDHDVGPRTIQKFVNCSAGGAEHGFNGQSPLIERAAVAQGVNPDDAEREDLALRFQKARERTPDVAITNQCQFQKSIFSIRVLSSDSSAVFLRFRLLCWSRSAAIFVSFAASWLAYCWT